MNTRAEHILFVHAHPDDESITTGGTIALLIECGTPVTVITATRGECGEIIPEALHYLQTDAAMLGRFRERELAEAMRVLGVTDHRFLGEEDARAPGLEPRRYVDSGMKWGEDGNPEPMHPIDPESLCAASAHEVAHDLLTVLRDTGATAIVTYNDFGGYGHPDHIAVHRATVLAARDAGIPVFAIETPRSAADASRAAVAQAGRFTPSIAQGATSVADDRITLTVDVSPQLPRKIAALRAHSTQLVVDGDQYALSNGTGELIGSTESYRMLPLPPAGEPLPPLSHRLLGYLLAGLIGVVFGTVATAAHRAVIAIGDVQLPVGLALGFAMMMALLVGFRIVLRDRFYVGSAAMGILLAVGLLALPGPSGSVIFPESILSLVWTFLPTLIAVVVIAWPRVPGRRA